MSGRRGGSGSRVPERSASFHGRLPAERERLRRPRTQPDLMAPHGRFSPENTSPVSARKVPAKVLVNVTVQRSLGPLHVVASTEWTVGELVAAAVRQYVKEGRRPALPESPAAADPSDAFGLHYSQFSLESLDPKEKLLSLGSRNFFLCPKIANTCGGTCGKEASAKESKKVPFSWLQFMDFLL
ncbi:hypothetical protein QJS10_CPB13g01694 [Acorus calamus]|uniref:DUF7054 domain-containing protein n=1 Tax=Acorus calamus TaxID=4465 RepID=A0AAV9DIY4_ACOCL|nr:hypothetical protein QJS10_CPB13g01694 [Acorus calamus]